MEEKKKEELSKTENKSVRELNFSLQGEVLSRNEENVLRMMYGISEKMDKQLVYDGKTDELKAKLALIEMTAVEQLRSKKSISPRQKIIDKLKTIE